jgi:hypothetical protein
MEGHISTEFVHFHCRVQTVWWTAMTGQCDFSVSSSICHPPRSGYSALLPYKWRCQWFFTSSVRFFPNNCINALTSSHHHLHLQSRHSYYLSWTMLCFSWKMQKMIQLTQLPSLKKKQRRREKGCKSTLPSISSITTSAALWMPTNRPDGTR